MLKAYTIEGPAQFTILPTTYVFIQDTKDTLKDGEGLVGRFFKWTAEQDIYPSIRGGHSGGGSHAGYYATEDAVRILAWLLEQGAVPEAPRTTPSG